MPTAEKHHGCSALLVIGAGGAGKTVVAQAVGGLLTTAGHATAVIDADALSQFGPPPQGRSTDRIGFYARLRCQNLTALWNNYRAAGARFVVLSGHVEHADLRRAYEKSLPGCDVQMVRLVAPIETLHHRIRARGRTIWTTIEAQVELATEAHELLERSRIEDFIVTNDRPLAEVASEAIERAGWPR